LAIPLVESRPFDTIYWNEAQLRLTSSPMQAPAGKPESLPASPTSGMPSGGLQASGAKTKGRACLTARLSPSALACSCFGASIVGHLAGFSL
jgi:hypothetical protein